MTAREELDALGKRAVRLGRARRALPPTHPRRRAITLARHRIWAQMNDLYEPAWWETVDEIWPNGLPAHP
jgi:hypothetical protein